jgi:glycosyltransferase involved in cell wall biosynthesis
MLLSIVIPTHNRVDYLKQCLKSLALSIAGHADCEVVVVDDHSRAEVATVNRTLCGSLHIEYVYLEKNQGAAIARNTGIEKSRGEWIAFLDDDICVDRTWYTLCRKALSELPASTIGVEGKVIAMGEGVWDKEVENLEGEAYMTCHIIYRKYIVDRIGRFDGRFASRYPTCEDHELAVRALLWGDIAFNPQLHAYHQPRTIMGAMYIRDSFHRMRTLLDAEFYFFQKHRDRYHLLRYARTFWGTYVRMALFHTFISLKRRPAARLLRHPLQSTVLVFASIIEQLSALVLFPRYVFNYMQSSTSFFIKHIDENRTRSLWQMDPNANASILKLKPRFFQSIFFPLMHGPVYSMAPVLRYLSDKSALSSMLIFLRIDDVFMHDQARVTFLCEKLFEKRIRFCAGVTGKDMAAPHYNTMSELIRRSGGEIALHGFTHSGRFGPFKSEMLQMNFPAIETKLRAVFDHMPQSEIPKIFIPPYNAINREQIFYLTRYFKVICGGPETARFTDYHTGPVALENDAWYFPSFFPFYTDSPNILKSKSFYSAVGQKGLVSITVHMPFEARDNYVMLMRLLSRVAEYVTPWDYLYTNPPKGG